MSSITARVRRMVAGMAMRAFAPRPQITVDAWADSFRVMPRDAPVQGRYRTDLTPFFRRPMCCLTDRRYREVVLCTGAQIGKSTIGENFLGFTMHQDPSGVLVIWPTQKKYENWSLTRLDPLLQDTPVLRAMFPRTGRRDSSDSLARKIFAGGWMMAGTAGSASDLKSDTAKRFIAEEVDEWDVDLDGQGDPLELLRLRLTTFGDEAKGLIVSTPTVWGASRIWKELLASTFEEYHVPCPHCGVMQVLRWRDGEDDADQTGAFRFVWQTSDSGDLIPGSVHYVCRQCDQYISERHKPAMLASGEWVPRFPDRDVAGFHLASLYSPFLSWDMVARRFIRAAREPGGMKAFVTGTLALPYKEPDESLDGDFLAGRAERYAAEVPHGVGALVTGGDVQGDRVELHTWGYGGGGESWVIAVEVFDGEPAQPEVWGRVLDYLRNRRFTHESGAQIPIAFAAIDAGHNTEMVHRFCERLANCIPVMGRSGPGRELLKAPEKDRKARFRSRKRPTYVVGIDGAKDNLDARLRTVRPPEAAPGEPVRNFVHFPEWADSAWFEQLTAEKRATRYVNGRPHRTWVLKSQGQRNEALDCAGYALAALRALEMRDPTFVRRLPEMARRHSEWKPAAEGAKPPARKAAKRTRVRSSFVSGDG